MAKMKLSDFMTKLELALSKKTVYLWGCFGHPVGQTIIDQKAAQYPTWYTPARIAYFEGLIGKHYFGFDCVNMIKGILWGWTGDEASFTGGAKYATQGVPDTNANGFFDLCTGKSKVFSNLPVGAILWMDGHVGIYRGNNEAIETTYRWSDGIQVTGIRNLNDFRTKSRTWSQWGLCPFIDYTSTVPVQPDEPPQPEPNVIYPDEYTHPDIAPNEKNYYYKSGFQPLGANSMHVCNISEFVDGFPPKKDSAGNPIPEGAICEVRISTPKQYCDIYRMAFGEWWKYANDDNEAVFDGYPVSPFSFEVYPVQIIAFDYFTNQTRLLAVKEEFYQKYIYPAGHFNVAGKWTDTVDGMIATLSGNSWINSKVAKSGGWTVSNIYRSTRNIWKTKTGSEILFPKNS